MSARDELRESHRRCSVSCGLTQNKRKNLHAHRNPLMLHLRVAESTLALKIKLVFFNNCGESSPLIPPHFISR